MDINALTGTSGMVSPASSSSGLTEGTLGKEDFLELLVAQLAHQDPLDPMENTEFVAQLAQFSSLEQLMGVNSNLGMLQTAELASANSQATALIGREVEATGSILRHTTPGPESINFTLPRAATKVTVKILDNNGNQVRSLDVGARPAGSGSVQWDGRDSLGNLLPTGNFTLDISATDASGNAIAASSKFSGVVTGVTFKNGIPVLEVGGTRVQLADVVSVRQQGSQ